MHHLRLNGAIIFVLAFNFLITSADESLPRFLESVGNVTVPLGKDAILSCAIKNLNRYSVVWVSGENHVILSVNQHKISLNPRISLIQNDHRSWNLEIKSVEETDKGWYTCKVNTDPMISKSAYLQVISL